MKRLLPLSFLLTLAFTLSLSTSWARADGIIIPDPPICDPGPARPGQFQFHGPTGHPLPPCHHRNPRPGSHHPRRPGLLQSQRLAGRGTICFPYLSTQPLPALPCGWMEAVEGEILDAEQARRTYERSFAPCRIQPCWNMPIVEQSRRGSSHPAGGERRIELEYSQALAAENGLSVMSTVEHREILRVPLVEVSISVDIRSSAPIRAVYSPPII